MSLPQLKLNDGTTIPQIGLGLWQITEDAQFHTAFKTAVDAGYRHFDTAQAYHNERLLGKALEESGLKREQVYITTKIAVQNFGNKKSRSSFLRSLESLRMDYVDLLLLHFPVPGLRKKTWTALEDIQRSGAAKSIGVSNFTVEHLTQLEKYARITPAVNQVEMHVFLQQDKLAEYCRNRQIVIEAYSPLAHAKEMDNAVINELAGKYGKSYAQIMLRWALQKDAVILPKSVTPQRIKENLDILDFIISDEDMHLLAGLDRNLHTCWNPELVP